LVIGKYTDVFRGDFFWWVGSREEGYVEGSFHAGIFHGGKELSMKGLPDFPALFKKMKN